MFFNKITKFLFFFRVGSDLGWSNYFYTKTLPDSTDWSPTIAMFGDMGTENAAREYSNLEIRVVQLKPLGIPSSGLSLEEVLF